MTSIMYKYKYNFLKITKYKDNRPEEVGGKSDASNEGKEGAGVKDWRTTIAHARAERPMEPSRVGSA